MNIPILYEDEDTLVIDKPSGLLSEASEREASVITHLAVHGTKGFLPTPITRLDREVSGVMLLARTKAGAAHYSALLADRERFQKEYIAVVSGTFAEKTGEMHDLLFKDSAKNKSYVVKRMRRGVKEASLSYTVLQERASTEKTLSLLHIVLYTGRTHQIRVQCASRGCPLLGDKRYGGDSAQAMGLFAYRLSFDTRKGKRVTVTAERRDVPPFSLFPNVLP